MKINTDKEKLLSHKHLISVLDYNETTGIFVWKNGIGGASKAGKAAGTCTIAEGYIRICLSHKKYCAHRLAWFYVYSSWPENEIDHINGDKQDNRIKNLRDVSVRENGSNKFYHRKGKLVGATFCKDKKIWRSQIEINKKTVHLGRFKTETEAHEAYKKALAGSK